MDEKHTVGSGGLRRDCFPRRMVLRMRLFQASVVIGLAVLTLAAPQVAQAEVERGVYKVRMVESEGAGLKHWLMLYTRRVRPEHDGAVYVSNGQIGLIPGEEGPGPNRPRRLPDAEPIRDGVWRLDRRAPDHTEKVERVVRSVSEKIADGRPAKVYAFGGLCSTPGVCSSPAIDLAGRTGTMSRMHTTELSH